MPNIYSFTIFATDTTSPELALRLWHRDRKTISPNLSWYGLDLVVKGPAEVTIDVHEIENNFSGGIGKVVLSYDPVLTAEDLVDLTCIIKRRQFEIARIEYHRREKLKVEFEIEKIRRQMFDAS